MKFSKISTTTGPTLVCPMSPTRAIGSRGARLLIIGCLAAGMSGVSTTALAQDGMRSGGNFDLPSLDPPSYVTAMDDGDVETIPTPAAEANLPAMADSGNGPFANADQFDLSGAPGGNAVGGRPTTMLGQSPAASNIPAASNVPAASQPSTAQIAAPSNDAADADSAATALTAEQARVNRSITQAVDRVEMLVKSSRILTLNDPVPRFQVHNDEILTATPISDRQIQIYARAAGSTEVNLWDTNEKMYTVNVTVSPDAREVEGILASQLPLAAIKVTPLQDAAILSGTVSGVDDVERAVLIAEQFYTNIINNIRVVGVQQVLLHTRIMEVSRTKLRSLGIDWGATSSDGFFFSGPSGLSDLSQSGFVGGGFGTVSGILPSAEGAQAITNRALIGGGDFEALISALREQRLIKFLAEPTVVATHGRPARFNVGGRVPYLVPTGQGNVSVGYEEFGTAVDFLPFVVGPGRIRLEVRPEVTEPDASRSITAGGISVSGFSTRYVETAIELQAGQTFAIAGLLQSRTDAVSRATPILGELPVFGSLFRRVRHQRNDIELLITVTPELVAAMDPHEVPRGGPGLNSMTPNDHELFIGGHLEVPNLNGQPTNCAPAAGDYGATGYQTNDCVGGVNAPSNYAGGGSVVVGEPFAGGTHFTPHPTTGAPPLPPGASPLPPGASPLPPGAIVPGEDPINVADGITISAPPTAEYFAEPSPATNAVRSGASDIVGESGIVDSY